MNNDFNKDLYVPVLRKNAQGREYFEYQEDIHGILMSQRKTTNELFVDQKVLPVNDDRLIFYQNCYAYALGFTTKAWYGPGIFSKQPDDLDFSEIDVLMNAVEQDLKAFKIGYRRVEKEEDKKVKQGEYLIKVFTVSKDTNSTEDYHFIRQDPETKLWFHKMGRMQPDLFNNGEDKKDFYVEDEKARKKYHYIEAGYFVLTE